jgi:hypothetical protein
MCMTCFLVCSDTKSVNAAEQSDANPHAQTKTMDFKLGNMLPGLFPPRMQR